MRLGARLLAAIVVAILVVTAAAPHSRDDSILFDDSSSDLIEPQEIHVTGCNRLPAGVTHLHRDTVREIDPCSACTLQHLRATASKIRLGTPQILEHALTITALVAHARSIRLRTSSRAPPIAAA